MHGTRTEQYGTGTRYFCEVIVMIAPVITNYGSRYTTAVGTILYGMVPPVDPHLLS